MGMLKESLYGWQRGWLPLFHVTDPRLTRGYDLGTPVVADVDRIVTSTNMKVGAYAVAAQPDVPRNLTVATTAVGAADTQGTVTITGTDVLGNAITEVFTPVAGTPQVGTKAFKTVNADGVVGAGWVIGEGNDTIVVGVGNLLGLPRDISAIDQVVLATLDYAVIALTGGKVVVDTPVSGCTIDLSAGTYNGSKTAYVLMVDPDPILSRVAALTLMSTDALGFAAVIEEFGFVVTRKLVGAGATLTFQLCNGSTNVIAELTVALADGALGNTISTTTMTKAYKSLAYTDSLTLKRKATGTGFSEGEGFFYCRFREKPQKEADES